MEKEKEDFDRRIDKRLELPLQISLYDQSGQTINISTTGVYFEVITDDIEAFSPGTTIPIQITTSNITHESKLKTLRLSGKGLIISREIEETTDNGIKLIISVRLKNKLNFWEPATN